jgi:hypothetical protein
MLKKIAIKVLKIEGIAFLVGLVLIVLLTLAITYTDFMCSHALCFSNEPFFNNLLLVSLVIGFAFACSFIPVTIVVTLIVSLYYNKKISSGEIK